MSVVGFQSGSLRSPGDAGPAAGVALHETASGYRIRTECRAGAAMRVTQSLSFLLGVAAVAFALALVAVPAMAAGPLGWGVAVILVALAALMFDFSRQTAHCEFEVDLAARELREVGRNRSGRLQVRARYEFSAVSGLFIDQRRGQDVLVLRLGQSERVLPVAMGTRDMLAPLAVRLGRDLFGPGAAPVVPRRPAPPLRRRRSTPRPA